MIEIREIVKGIIQVVINRPPANALNIEAIQDLESKFVDLASNPPAYGVVFTGHGAIFCAGVDTRAFNGYGGQQRLVMAQSITRMTAAILSLPVPLVAAINGHALGGGLVLSLCCDWRIANDDPKVKLGLPEAVAGVAFPAGPVEILHHELSGSAVRRLTLSSETMSPQSMQTLGVIDEVCARDDLLERAHERIRAFADQPGFSIVKRQIRGPLADKVSALAREGSEPFWTP